jgi:DNA modification methylase
MEPYYEEFGISLHCGDSLTILRTLPAESVHCCVTSPPYWGLRDYGVEGQLGLEPSPEAYTAKMVQVFREVRRVLRDDGTLWLNLGNSYARNPAKGGNGPSGKNGYGEGYAEAQHIRSESQGTSDGFVGRGDRAAVRDGGGLGNKQLVGIPWRVAFALQADGWYLRSDIIWAKPNPMPESVTDRPTKSHEYLFLLAKSERYYYDAEAIAEPAAYQVSDNRQPSGDYSVGSGRNDGGMHRSGGFVTGPTRNRRSVWTISTEPYPGAHFATFPPDLVRPCILAGCPHGGVVLDCFAGSGTTLQVAKESQCGAIGIELNPEYCGLITDRLQQSVFDFTPEVIR